MSGNLVRLRVPVTSVRNLGPGLAAIRALCAAPVPPSHIGSESSQASSRTNVFPTKSAASVNNSGKPELSSVESRSNTATVQTAVDAESLSAGSGVEKVPSASSGSANGSHQGSTSQGENAVMTASKWFWRSSAVVAGAAVAGGAVMVYSDPDGSHEALQSLRHNINEKVKYFTEPSREKLLPDAVPPYPGAQPVRTLVIDLDNTLVHSSFSRQFGWRVAKRPGLDAFLAYLSSLYEIVIFTDGLNSYADPILNKLDPNRYYVAHRLYRAETKYEGGAHIKDLSCLNRELSRVILIDHDSQHFKYHPENAIQIPKWSDDASDTALLDLIPFLEGLVQEDCADVREEIQKIQGKPLKTALVEYRSLSALRAEKPGPGSRGGLFGASLNHSSVRSVGGRGGVQSPEQPAGVADDSSTAPSDSAKKESRSILSHAGKKGSMSIFRPS